jgi:hypothetical protein
VTEPSKDRLTLRQADAARADLFAIHDELDFIKVQLARFSEPRPYFGIRRSNGP